MQGRRGRERESAQKRGTPAWPSVLCIHFECPFLRRQRRISRFGFWRLMFSDDTSFCDLHSFLFLCLALLSTMHFYTYSSSTSLFCTFAIFLPSLSSYVREIVSLSFHPLFSPHETLWRNTKLCSPQAKVVTCLKRVDSRPSLNWFYLFLYFEHVKALSNEAAAVA